jgi:hypothetical protein
MESLPLLPVPPAPPLSSPVPLRPVVLEPSVAVLAPATEKPVEKDKDEAVGRNEEDDGDVDDSAEVGGGNGCEQDTVGTVPPGASFDGSVEPAAMQATPNQEPRLLSFW